MTMSPGPSNTPGPAWPDPGGGMSTELPPGRIVFQSESGEACCGAGDAELLRGALVVVDNLPAGPATVTFAGFATDFAPAVPGITETCETIPADAAQPCDPQRVASPAF